MDNTNPNNDVPTTLSPESIKQHLAKSFKSILEQTKEEIAQEIVEDVQASGVNDTNLPEHLKNNPFLNPEVITEPEFLINKIFDNGHDDVGFLVVQEDGSVNAYLADGIDLKSVKHKTIQQFIDAGETRIPIIKSAVIDFQPHNQVTCKWFSPSEKTVEDTGAELGEEYGFDRPHPWPTCSNPDVIKAAKKVNPPCRFEQSMSLCATYNTQEWRVVRTINVTAPDGSTGKVIAKENTLGSGLRTYRIFSKDDASEIMTLEETVSVGDYREKIQDALEEKLADVIASFTPINLEDIPLPASETQKEKYFDYVLAD